MLAFLKKKKGAKKIAPASDITPNPLDGVVYAVGDIHGCHDELSELLDLIEADAKAVPNVKKHIVFLGDLIDRGPASNKVIALLSQKTPGDLTSIFIKGNHEEMFLKVLTGDLQTLSKWFEYGGKETCRSYGVKDLGAFLTRPHSILVQIMQNVPKEDFEFMKSFQDYFIAGPYLFVHAGIKPKRPLKEQKTKDFRWIRKEFLTYEGKHPYIVVHGHSIVEKAQSLPNRIAIDTGAYRGGPLTAARLDKDGVTFIQTAVKAK